MQLGSGQLGSGQSGSGQPGSGLLADATDPLHECLVDIYNPDRLNLPLLSGHHRAIISLKAWVLLTLDRSLP